MSAYYNEHDPYAAQWLRNLVAAGEIAPGVVDETDILDVNPDDLRQYTQCHFFAGIGIWSYALRNAGVSDDTPVWTGSCPCQPFSAAGKRAGVADERHLWPAFHYLIEQCKPAVVLGEQVASKDGLLWLDTVSADLEGSGYAFGASDLCAAGITIPWEQSQSGAWLRRAIHSRPDAVALRDFAAWAGENLGEGGHHIRQRLYFVGLADGDDAGRQGRLSGRTDPERENLDGHAGRDSAAVGARNAASGGLQHEPDARPAELLGEAAADTGIRAELGRHHPGLLHGQSPDHAGRGGHDWLLFKDNKFRAVEPRTSPLADGVTARMGKLRAFGNALDGKTATRFIEVVKEIA